jgi:sulfide:quinone oxidoreductase
MTATTPGPQANARSRRVLIVGGGVAGIECLLGLRDRLGSSVDLSLISDADEFCYRPMAVGEPFGIGHASHYPLAALAQDCGAELIVGRAERFDVAAHAVVTQEGGRFAYDALIVALGAVPFLPLRGATLLEPDPRIVARLLQDVESGAIRRLAVVVPPGPHWVLPAYELVLLLERYARTQDPRLALTLITTETAPLEILGPDASKAVGRELAGAGVRLLTGSRAALRDDDPTRVLVSPGATGVDADRVVALPLLHAPSMPGLPCGQDGFLPVDPYGRLRDAPDVYAAGDCTEYPVKQGGLAAQQADAVVEHLAARFGVGSAPEPFRPVLRGRLLTGGPTLWVRRDLTAPADQATSADHALWWPPGKIAGRWLSPYLAARDDTAAGITHAPAHGRRLEIPLDAPSVPMPRDLELLGAVPSDPAS